MVRPIKKQSSLVQFGWTTLTCVAFTCVALPLSGSSALAQDTLKFDFSTAGDGDGGSLADWNQFATATTIPAGSVIRDGDGAIVPGVSASLQVSGANGFNNDPNSSGWGGLGSDPFFIAAADDIVFSNQSVALTVSGLDDLQTYEVRSYSLINNQPGRIVDLAVTNGVGTVTRENLDRQVTFNTVPLSSDLVFENVLTDGNGNISVTADADGDFFAFNAVTITETDNSSPLANGDTLKFDFSTAGDGDGGSTQDWNQFAGPGSSSSIGTSTIAAGRVRRDGDGSIVDGVSASFQVNGTGGFNNDPNSSGWGGLASDPFLIGAADDIVFSNDSTVLTVSGLDDSLSYDVRAYSLINNQPGRIVDLEVTNGGGAVTRDNLDRQVTFNTVPLSNDLIFSNIMTDGSGNITVTADADGDFFAFNALTVTAFDLPTPLVGGDVLKFDLSDAGDGDGGSLDDWNQFNGPASSSSIPTSTIAAGRVRRDGDGSFVAGVSATLEINGSAGFNNDALAAGWAGLATDPFLVAAADDIAFSNGSIVLTLSGLDDSLTYNLRAYSLIDQPGRIVDVEATDGAGTILRDNLDRGVLFGTVPLDSDLIFSDLSTDGQGNIIVTFDADGDFFALNALTLEANPSAIIPEPASSMLWSLLGLAGLRRGVRRR